MNVSNPLKNDWQDHSVDPTEDFYSFTNGGWLANNPVPQDQSLWGAFSEIQKNNDTLLKRELSKPVQDQDDKYTKVAKNYFASGINEKQIEARGLTPLQDYIDSVNSIDSIEELTKVLAKLQLAGLDAPFGWYVMPDFDAPNNNLLYLGQSGLGLPERSYYLKTDEQSVALQTAYQGHIAKQLNNANIQGNPNDIYDFEKQLAEASYPPEKLRDNKLTLVKYDLNEVAERLKNFDIKLFLQIISIDVDVLSINNIGFFETLDSLMIEQNINTIRSYLIWFLIKRFSPVLPKTFEQEAFSFYGTALSGQSQQKPRWKRVLDLATNDIGDALAKVYVTAAFSDTSKKRCENMVQDLLKSMQIAIDELDWMSTETKKSAQTKLSKFSYKIGYPKMWHEYSNLDISASEPLSTNHLRAIIFESKRQIAKLGKSVDQDEWAMPAHVVNAYYHPLMNQIVFPAGILQPPMFYENAPDPVIYGAIGAVIGHEITHGFDDQGSQFDGDGNLANWWKDIDRQEFEKRANILVNQFNSYEIQDGIHVNGQLTLGENIADMGGLKLAYQAYLLSVKDKPVNLEDKKLFFASYATIWRTNYKPEIAKLLINIDTHAPAKFRANGPLSNFEPFTETYNIPDDMPMHIASNKSVNIW